jgi:hypothetical protein
MNEDRHGLFKQLEPPPGGAERFRARIEGVAERDRGRPAWRVAFAVAAGVVVIVGALVVLSDAERNSVDSAENLVAAAPEFDRLLGRPVELADPAVTLNDQSVTLAAIPSENPKIRMYQIQ